MKKETNVKGQESLASATGSAQRKLRIVRDGYAGFEVQEAKKLFGIIEIWRQPKTNTHTTIEDARRWAENIERHMADEKAARARKRLAGMVVEYIAPNSDYTSND